MQSIHLDMIFNMLSRRGQFKRNYLFCMPCINWAKSEILRYRAQEQAPIPTQPDDPQHLLVQSTHNYSPISEIENRSTPDPFLQAEQQTMTDTLNEQFMDADSYVAQRLADPNESPLRNARKYMKYFFSFCVTFFLVHKMFVVLFHVM